MCARVEHGALVSAATRCGDGLDEDVLEAGTVSERRDEEGVEAEAAGETEVSAFAGHADDGVFDGVLQAGSDMCAQLFGNRRVLGEAEAFVEAWPEAAVIETGCAEVRTIEARFPG